VLLPLLPPLLPLEEMTPLLLPLPPPLEPPPLPLADPPSGTVPPSFPPQSSDTIAIAAATPRAHAARRTTRDAIRDDRFMGRKHTASNAARGRSPAARSHHMVEGATTSAPRHGEKAAKGRAAATGHDLEWLVRTNRRGWDTRG
jgi:hypothetical protein